jgi:hypothetical protein
MYNAFMGSGAGKSYAETKERIAKVTYYFVSSCKVRRTYAR